MFPRSIAGAHTNEIRSQNADGERLSSRRVAGGLLSSNSRPGIGSIPSRNDTLPGLVDRALPLAARSGLNTPEETR